MITVEEAQQKAEEYLRRKYSNKPYELVVMKSLTREEDFGWIFFFNTREFAESGTISAALGGNTPLIVDRETGDLHVTGTAHPVEYYVDAYRRTRTASPGRRGEK